MPENGNESRVLTNVRCLSEGVDVPSLDAVIHASQEPAREAQKNVNESRVLTNVRCLSEGIDVPSLDAVIHASQEPAREAQKILFYGYE
jgi:predicted helicase